MKFLVFMERDLRKFFRNPMFVLASIAMPLLYLIILGNSFQGELKHLPIALVDQDNGPYSTRIKGMFQAIEAGPKTFSVFLLNDQQEALRFLKKGEYKAILIIPPNFSQNVFRKVPAELGLIVDNTDSISAATIGQRVSMAIAGLKEDYIFLRELPQSTKLKYVEYYPKVDYDQSLIPGVVVMAIFMGTMSAGVFNLIMDKFLGVHESYMVTPLSKKDIIFGFVSSGVILSTLISVSVFLLSTLITGVVIIGGLKTFFIILFVIILSAIGLLNMMFVFLGRADHPRIVGIFSGFLNVILFFPSGAIYPIASFPSWLQAFSRVNPQAYTVHALRSLIFKGPDLTAIREDMIFLIIFTIIMSTLSTLTFKRSL